MDEFIAMGWVGGGTDANRGWAESGTESPAHAVGLRHFYRSIPVA